MNASAQSELDIKDSCLELHEDWLKDLQNMKYVSALMIQEM